MGFWAAMDEILNPTTAPPTLAGSTRRNERASTASQAVATKAKAAIHNIWQAENPRTTRNKAFDLFIKTYEPSIQGVLCLQKDREELMAFFDFPPCIGRVFHHNPIESAFATIRQSPKRSKGCLSRDGMLL